MQCVDCILYAVLQYRNYKMNNNNQQSAKNLSTLYDRISLIFHAILAPPLIAFVWLYLETEAGNIASVIDDQSTIDTLRFIFPILIIGAVAGAFFFFKSGLGTINPDSELIEKVKAYFVKAILLYAMLEVGLILSVLGYYITQEGVFIAMFITVLIFFSLYKPTLQRISKHLNIKGEDKSFLIDCRRIARGEEKEKRRTF